MPFIPDPPFPKSSGDNIRSKDWNDVVKELQRLDTAKLDKTGGPITGPLSVSGALTVGTQTPEANRSLTIERNTGAYLNLRSTLTGGPFEVLLGADGSGGIVSTMTNHDLQLRAGNNDTKMIIKAGGNVGIGELSPYAKLTLAGSLGFKNSTAPMLYIYESGGSEPERPIISHSPGFPTWGLSYRDVGDKMVFQAGGQPVLTVDLGARRVGIGTDAPTQPLEVNGNAFISNVFLGDVGHSSTWAGFSHRTAAGTTSYGLLQNNDGLFTLINKKSGGGYIGFRVDNNDKMVINDAGHVGIGLTNPGRVLDVRAASGIKLGLEGSGGGQLILANNANDNRVYMEAFSADGNGHAAELLLTGRFAAAVPQISLVAATTVVTGLLRVNGGKTGYIVDQFVNRHGEAVEEGDVVVIGMEQASLHYGLDYKIPVPEVDLAQQAYDTRVCGIVHEIHVEMEPAGTTEPTDEKQSAKKAAATQPGLIRKKGKKIEKVEPQTFTSSQLEQLDRTQVAPGQTGLMVTLGAFAHCKVDADIAPINVGDLLTTSPTKGHAQKVLDPTKATGAIIGKALGSLKKGKAKIPVLVTLH
ncbi:MAG TPA: hypothetical protein VJ810_02845 [Blastocatellia bacterium]|nr:hypothetical protein [Blastocatellia bacterium]